MRESREDIPETARAVAWIRRGGAKTSDQAFDPGREYDRANQQRGSGNDYWQFQWV